MDLLVVCHVLLREDTLDLVEVPVWDARNRVHLLGRPPHVSVLAIQTVYTESKSVIVALAMTRRMVAPLVVPTDTTATLIAIVVSCTALLPRYSRSSCLILRPVISISRRKLHLLQRKAKHNEGFLVSA